MLTAILWVLGIFFLLSVTVCLCACRVSGLRERDAERINREK